MMLAAECGSELVLTVEGADEEEAMEAVATFLETESE
jgi:phosphotransferase system HPr-like phosphotransfer protein